MKIISNLFLLLKMMFLNLIVMIKDYMRLVKELLDGLIDASVHMVEKRLKVYFLLSKAVLTLN